MNVTLPIIISNLLKNSNLNWIFLSLLVVTVLLVYFLKNKKGTNYKDYIKNYYEIKFNNDKYGSFIFFSGFLIAFTEMLYNFYIYRPKNLAIQNFSIGLFLMLFYIAVKKIPFLLKNVRIIFIIIYLLYLFFVYNNLVINQFSLITYTAFLVILYFSFTLYKTIKEFIAFNILLIAMLLNLYIGNYLPVETISILSIAILIINALNYLRHLSTIKDTENILFATDNDIKNNSVTVATNKNGELIYCSDNIEQILGYKPIDVLGKVFWKLTEDIEYSNYISNPKNSDNPVYIRKLKCFDGSFKYIQWTEKKFSDDITLSIGKDVTQFQQIQNQYKNVIENATDLIFETDITGKFTYLNKFVYEKLGYSLEETINEPYIKFIRKDYVEKAKDYLKKFSENPDSTNAFDYPVLKKNGESIWVSQKISVNKNNQGVVTGYSAIARDITLLKQLEIEKKYKEIKVQKYNDFKTKITLKSFSTDEDFASFLEFLLKSIAKIVDTNRVSYWEYEVDKIVCLNLYERNKDTFESNLVLSKKDFPLYFEIIENEHQLVENDVFSNTSLTEFQTNYFPENNIQSMLDTSIYLNGDLKGILCLESNTKLKKWDTEDVNFVKSISDFIAIYIETSLRIETEKKTKYKSDLLSALTKITNSFIKDKNIYPNFNETLATIGKAANVDRAYYFSNNSLKETVSYQYEWVNQAIEPFINEESLKDFSHFNFGKYIDLLKNNQCFNAITKPLEESEFKKALELQNIKSILFIPIFIKKVFKGFIGFDDCTNERIWSEDEINILQNLANNISSALESYESDNLVSETEERFQLLAENIPGTVYLSKNDENYTKIYINDEIEKLTGYPKEDFLSNKMIYTDLIHPSDKEEVIKNQKKCISKGTKIHQTYRIYNKSNSIVWVEEFGDVIKKDNIIVYIEGIFIDITDRKRNEKAVEKRLLAEAANKAKSDFLANMSHEIRTPLNGIIGFTDLLKNITLDEVQINYMETISQSANSLMEIINDILDFSKIESGKLDLDTTKCDIYELSKQAIGLVKYEATKKNLKLNLVIDEQIPRYIFADNVRLKQIIMNLLSNAVKFTRIGSVELSINLLEKKENNKYKLCFKVKDTGVGIKEEYIDKIFDAFSQGDNSTSRKFGGTGLGLTISNQLLNLMKSKLELKSVYKEGTEFFFDVVFEGINSDANLNQPIEIVTAPKKNNIIDFGQENYKILVVEDNNINMLLAKTLVKQIVPKSIVYEAINGKEAVEKFTILKPDLILMDVQMPIMNGYEATQEIRKLKFGTHIPIIALTAGIVSGEKEKCINVGMNDYASKPIIKETLQSIISKWIKI